jgi:hypothetical protein
MSQSKGQSLWTAVAKQVEQVNMYRLAEQRAQEINEASLLCTTYDLSIAVARRLARDISAAREQCACAILQAGYQPEDIEAYSFSDAPNSSSHAIDETRYQLKATGELLARIKLVRAARSGDPFTIRCWTKWGEPKAAPTDWIRPGPGVIDPAREAQPQGRPAAHSERGHARAQRGPDSPDGLEDNPE